MLLWRTTRAGPALYLRACNSAQTLWHCPAQSHVSSGCLQLAYIEAQPQLTVLGGACGSTAASGGSCAGSGRRGVSSGRGNAAMSERSGGSSICGMMLCSAAGPGTRVQPCTGQCEVVLIQHSTSPHRRLLGLCWVAQALSNVGCIAAAQRSHQSSSCNTLPLFSEEQFMVCRACIP